MQKCATPSELNPRDALESPGGSAEKLCSGQESNTAGAKFTKYQSRPTKNLFRKPVPEGTEEFQSPARECRERKATETKFPLGDGTTNLLVRVNSNLKSTLFR